MLCFLPPLPVPRDERPEPPASGGSTTAAIVIVLLTALCAILAPFGWTVMPRRAATEAHPVPLVGKPLSAPLNH